MVTGPVDARNREIITSGEIEFVRLLENTVGLLNLEDLHSIGEPFYLSEFFSTLRSEMRAQEKVKVSA